MVPVVIFVMFQTAYIFRVDFLLVYENNYNTPLLLNNFTHLLFSDISNSNDCDENPLTNMSTAKAFTNPSAAKIEQQRKILEELERQKKQIKTSKSSSNLIEPPSIIPASDMASSTTAPNIIPGTQTAAITGGGSMLTTPSISSSSAMAADTAQTTQQMSSNQRKALEEANKTSFGFFITQDSSFGNLILPVIPRIAPQGNTIPAPAPVSTVNPS